MILEPKYIDNIELVGPDTSEIGFVKLGTEFRGPERSSYVHKKFDTYDFVPVRLDKNHPR